MHNRPLNDLPAEILLNVFSYLRLTELFQLMLVNTYLSQLLEDNHFWKKRYKRSFPRLWNTFSEQENINWKDEVKFIANLELEYKDLPEVIKNMFIAIRTSDVLLLSRNYEKHNENYLNYPHHPISNKTFRDRNTIDTPLECAHRMESAEIFSYFFKLKLEYLECYTLTAEKYSIDLVFAAILFHSPLKSIKDVLTEEMIIKYRDQDGNTLLMLATRHKSAETGAYLINHGVQINAKNKYGQTALMLATQYGNNDLVKLLLHKDAKKTSNLLQIAAVHQQLIAAKLLLEHGVSPQQFNSNEHPPLTIAINNHDIEMTELLLDYGADVNYAKQYHGTPLYYAAFFKNEAMIQVLLKNHVNTDVVSTNSMRNAGIADHDKLIHVCIRRGMLSTMRTLFDQGMDIDLVNRINETPLHVAVLQGDINIVEYLLKTGANVNAQDAKGRTALFLAVVTHQNKMAELLLSYQANANIATKESVACYIMAQNQAVYIKHEAGDLPLHVALVNGNTILVPLLVAHGAEVNIHQKQSFFGKVCATLFGRWQEKEDGMELKTLNTSQKQVSGKDLTSAPSATTISSLRNSSKMI